MVDRTRGIVLEWVDRGGGVKKKGNGRGLTGVRTGDRGGWGGRVGGTAGAGGVTDRGHAGTKIGVAGRGVTLDRHAAGYTTAARMAQVEWEEQGSAVCKTACIRSC